MKNWPLRKKILVYSSVLLVALIASTLLYVSYQAEGFVNERIGAELSQGLQRVTAAENDRLVGLRLTARLVASIPSLKALLDTDFGTIRDFLLSYQQENKLSDLLIVLDPFGKVIARTDAPTPTPLPGVRERWVEPCLEGREATGILSTDNGVYHAAAAPAAAGGMVFGFVIAGSAIDDGFARMLRDVSHTEIAILGDRLLATTIAAENLPWRSRLAWDQSTRSVKGAGAVEISNETYAAAGRLLGPDSGPQPLAVILQSRDKALAPYRRIQVGLLVLGLAVALAGIIGSAVVARNVTAPVAKLVEGTREVAAGNFDFRLEVRSGDEIGDLARSFNYMIQGLRERADMQKFVSQSTVHMIETGSRKPSAASERVMRTIFFSDVRGFTALAERRPAEEVVSILNRCFSVQAEQVRKFGGDIDKYVGDCIVALFAGDDMDLNAIRCALEIHKALDRLNRQSGTEEPVILGFGIATGEVILGSIGSEDRLDYTAIGSHVNLASRLCSMAGPWEILLAESTYQRVSDLVAAQRLDAVKVKGFTDSVAVYRMTFTPQV